MDERIMLDFLMRIKEKRLAMSLENIEYVSALTTVGLVEFSHPNGELELSSFGWYQLGWLLKEVGEVG